MGVNLRRLPEPFARLERWKDPTVSNPIDRTSAPEKPSVAATLLGTVALAVVLVLSGLMVCTLPGSTWLLSSAFSDDELSPYTRHELVVAALATRDYTVGSHDREALQNTLDTLESNLAASLDTTVKDASGKESSQSERAAKALADGAIAHSNSADGSPGNSSSIIAFGEKTTLPEDALSHLDDVWRVLQPVYALYILAVAIAAASAWQASRAWASPLVRRAAGRALFAAGAIVLAAFLAFGVWAILDFNGLFALLHSLFFAEGTWTFSYESLLICMYPLPFWMGMGVIWLAVTVAGCAGCIAYGKRLATHAR